MDFLNKITNKHLGMAFAGIACVGVAKVSDTASRAMDDVTFWSTLQVMGDEVEGYESLTAMAESADLVVSGQFSSFKHSRTILGEYDDVVVYGMADLKVNEVLRGNSDIESVPVEFLIPYSEELAPAALDALSKSLTRNDVVLFLREKEGDDEVGLYRLVNYTGLWIDDKEGGVRAPLSDDGRGDWTKDGGSGVEELADIEHLQDSIRE
ncbi:MAG: hypothetical protein V3W41_02065 [Planctomycetota bacterium]